MQRVIGNFARHLLSGKRPVFALMQSVSTQFLILAINMATGIITARTLGADGRGYFAAVTTWPQMFTFLAMAGLGKSVLYYQCKTEENSSSVIGAGLLIGLCTTTIALVAGYLAIPVLLAKYDGWVQDLALASIAFVYVNSATLYIFQILPGAGAFRLLNISLSLQPFTYLVALALTFKFGTLTMTTAVTCLYGASVVSLAMTAWAVLRVIRVTLPTTDDVRTVGSYASRAAPTEFIAALATYIDRLFLIPLVPAREASLYVVAYSFSRLILVIQPAINAVVFPNMTRRNRYGVKKLHDLIFRLTLHASLAGGALLMLIDKWLLQFVYGTEFAEASHIFRILVFEAALACLAQITAQVYYSLDRPGFVSAIQSASFMLLLLGCVILVPTFGAVGAAAALLMSTSGRLAMLMAGFHFKLRLRLPRLALGKNDFDYIRNRIAG